MTTATAVEWIESTDYAPSPRPTDLQEFFGIPPSPPDALDANIRSKRKHWKKKHSKARSTEALSYSEAVLQAIDEAEDALKRGVAATEGGESEAFGGTSPRREPATIDEVWRELERLLFRGRYGDALTRVQDYEPRWGTYPAFVDVRAWVILEAVQNAKDITIDAALLASAVDGSRAVIAQLGPTEARYLTLIDLLEAAGRRDEITGVIAEATAALGDSSPSFLLKKLSLEFDQPWQQILRRCVGLVDQWPDDRALRSDLVQAIIARVTAELLPLKSAGDIERYRMVVATAAWIALGVPEAEDFVRLHRMWATNADQPIFGGNWQWRGFFGLITLFIGLPIINAMMARPAYQILLEGPALGLPNRRTRGRTQSRNRSWVLVTNNPYVEPVHEQTKLPWQSAPGNWPDIDSSTLFNF